MNELWSFGESDCSDNQGSDIVQSSVAEVRLKMKQIWLVSLQAKWRSVMIIAIYNTLYIDVCESRGRIVAIRQGR